MDSNTGCSTNGRKPLNRCKMVEWSTTMPHERVKTISRPVRFLFVLRPVTTHKTHPKTDLHLLKFKLCLSKIMSAIAPILKAIRIALDAPTDKNIQALADVAGLTIKKEVLTKSKSWSIRPKKVRLSVV